MAKNTFAEELKARRKKNGHTMEQVATIVGIPDRRIYGKIEGNRYLLPNGKPKDIPSDWSSKLRKYQEGKIGTTKEATSKAVVTVAETSKKKSTKTPKLSAEVQVKLWTLKKKRAKLHELIQNNPVTSSMVLERIWSWNPKRNKSHGLNTMGYMAADIHKGVVTIGVSICHESDTFKTKIGRAMAIERISKPISMVIKEDGGWNPANFFELQYLRFVQRVVKYYKEFEVVLPNITFIE